VGPVKLWGVGVRGGSGASEKCRGAKADFNATTGKWVGEGNLKGPDGFGGKVCGGFRQ
jgi:hypothetical protein